MKGLVLFATICGVAAGTLGMRYLLGVSPWLAGVALLGLLASVSWLEAIGREKALNREFFGKLRSAEKALKAQDQEPGTPSAEPGTPSGSSDRGR